MHSTPRQLRAAWFNKEMLFAVFVAHFQSMCWLPTLKSPLFARWLPIPLVIYSTVSLRKIKQTGRAPPPPPPSKEMKFHLESTKKVPLLRRRGKINSTQGAYNVLYNTRKNASTSCLVTTEVSVGLVPVRGSFGSSTRRLIGVTSEVLRFPVR